MASVRTYRIEPFNGAELVIQETFRDRDLSQEEYNKFSELVSGITESCFDYAPEEERMKLCAQAIADARAKFVLDNHIPAHEELPSVVISGVYFDRHIREVNIRCKDTVSGIFVTTELSKFFQIFDSLHWRNMIACQRDNYGSLFDSDND